MCTRLVGDTHTLSGYCPLRPPSAHFLDFGAGSGAFQGAFRALEPRSGGGKESCARSATKPVGTPATSESITFALFFTCWPAQPSTRVSE